MKILVDNGCYDLVNLGDVSMLQVTIKRLRDLDANISIFSKSNETISVSALDIYLDEIVKEVKINENEN